MPPERTAECSLPIADCNRRRSPNPNALFRCDEHRVGGLDFEGVVPDIGISSGTNHTKLTRGMRVAYDLLFDIIICDFSASANYKNLWITPVSRKCSKRWTCSLRSVDGNDWQC